MNYDQYIGKYVCFGNSDGGFCFGRIKSAIRVNSAKGGKDMFVMTDRTVCPGKPYKAATIRHLSHDTLLQIDKIDLDRDIVERSEVFKDLTDDELFLLVMDGEVDLKRLGNKGLGIINLCESATYSGAVVKQELQDRLAK